MWSAPGAEREKKKEERELENLSHSRPIDKFVHAISVHVPDRFS